MRFNRFCIVRRLSLLCLIPFTFSHCKTQENTKASSSTQSSSSAAPQDSATLIKINFSYGSEKEKWITQATAAFNAKELKTAKGRTIFIDSAAMGSGQCIDEILSGTRETHLVSPASAAFIELGNAQSNTENGKNLVNNSQELCLSPVVIAMWKPMAEALGYGEKPIGWKEIIDITNQPEGWAAHGMPQWGQFRLGHTHPDYSNSGLISLIAETYAATGKKAGLTSSDIAKPATGDYLEAIENSIVHYGKSTGFFGRKMFANGPSYLSAAVLYENMVIESYERPADQQLDFPIVAIYPKEGTFYSDHPVGIVNRQWVTPEHQEACQLFIDFLLTRDQQEKAMQFGFRPANPKIALSDKFTATYGVDKNQPQTLLELPTVAVINDIRQLWLKKKKKSHIVLAIDTSGSMKEQGKMKAAKKGALKMLEQLGDEDMLSIVTFSSNPTWINKNAHIGTHRKQLERQINSLIPNGKTALYDAISQGFTHLQQSPDKDSKITAVVVLSDGANTTGTLSSPASLLNQIGLSGEDRGTRIFTIAYGSGATPKKLSIVAEAAKGKNYRGSTANIKKVFEEIATFF